MTAVSSRALESIRMADDGDRHARLAQSANLAGILRTSNPPSPSQRFYDLGPRNLPEQIGRLGERTWRQCRAWSDYATTVSRGNRIYRTRALIEALDRFVEHPDRLGDLFAPFSEIADRTGCLLEAVIMTAVLEDMRAFETSERHCRH